MSLRDKIESIEINKEDLKRVNPKEEIFISHAYYAGFQYALKEAGKIVGKVEDDFCKILRRNQ